jgi:hypothetical protein|eukprot:COSAG01_NODE_1394_length_10482_cov_127.211211_9_plen_80_part_00
MIGSDSQRGTLSGAAGCDAMHSDPPPPPRAGRLFVCQLSGAAVHLLHAALDRREGEGGVQQLIHRLVRDHVVGLALHHL